VEDGPPGVEGPVVGVHEPCRAAVYRLDETGPDRCTLDEAAALLSRAAGAGVLKAVVSLFSTGGGDADVEPLS
jgi:hypothetical protein